MKVVVVGASGQGRQVIDVLRSAGGHEVVAIVDPGLAPGTSVVGVPVVAPDDLAGTGATGFVVGIGDNTVRATATAAMLADHPGLVPVAAIHPAAVVATDAALGAGVILMAGAVVSNGCTVGDGVLLGTRASLDHDGVLGDHASLAPGATTGGDVRIGDRSAVLLGASVIHGVTIGSDTVVGAGAVVLGDLPDGVVAFGVPARVVRTRAAGEPYLQRRSAGPGSG